MTRRNPGLPLARPEQLGLSESRLAQLLDAGFAAEIDKGLLPGAVLLVARRGKIAHFTALGRRDPEQPAAMAVDDVFRIYSMTKPVVATAAMMLFEEGRFLLNEPIGAYLPELAQLEVGTVRRGADGEESLDLAPAKRPIAIHDIFRHTSGLTYGFTGTGPIHKLYQEHKIDGHRGQSNAELVEKLGRLPLIAEPGTLWAYSVATDVLGRLIEVISGQTLGTFLQQRIFEPLGMVDTGFSLREADQQRLAQPFKADPETGQKVALHDVLRAPRFESGGGGLVSTALDYARFCQMSLNGGTLDGVRLLSRKTLAFMTADHLGPIRGIEAARGPGIGFGLGYGVRLHPGIATHQGSQGNYFWGGAAGTRFFIDPQEQLFAILMNQAPGRRERYVTLLPNLVYGCFDD